MTTRWHVAADDPIYSQKEFFALIETSQNPRHTAMLELLVRHDGAEIDRDMETVMSTLAPEPVYGWTPAGKGPRGTDEVRAHYERMFARGGIGNLTARRDRVLIDDHAVMMEHRVTRIVPWSAAERSGFVLPERGGHYAIHSDLATVVVFDDEVRILGERSYGFGQDQPAPERVPDDELSPGYLAWISRFMPEDAAAAGVRA